MPRSPLRRIVPGSSPTVDPASDRIRLGIGRLAALAVRDRSFEDIRNAEFTVYSQFGEDGILQYLISKTPGIPHRLVEIGVQDYEECNSRFLVCADNWQGLVVDADDAHLATIDALGLRWRFGLVAETAWITRGNVVPLILDHDLGGRELGLLSLDIDGNDYWILEALGASSTPITPALVVVEYNSIFGPDRAVTVPYREDFDRASAHGSHLYYGASLAALHASLAAQGYQLAGSNSAGNNAFFVRSDVGGALPDLTPQEAYVRSVFREARDTDGELLYIDPHRDGVRLIAEMPLVDVLSGESCLVGDCVNLPPP